jgi:hypothetical protein
LLQISLLSWLRRIKAESCGYDPDSYLIK